MIAIDNCIISFDLSFEHIDNRIMQAVLTIDNEQIDVFNRNLICNDPDDLWSANNSIPKLLFQKTFLKKLFVLL